MKDVYEKNPQMGDPASLASQINQTSQNIERLRGELAKYEVTLTAAAAAAIVTTWRESDALEVNSFGRVKLFRH